MNEIKEKIVSELEGVNADISMIEKPAESKLGDYALPCFVFAKKLKKNPNDIAKDLKKELEGKLDFVNKIEANGPYLNFFIKKDYFAKVLKDIHEAKEEYGKFPENKKVTIIEGPSPNTNKPLHLGHVRNMVICKTLLKVMNAAGYSAKHVNLNNDRGIHICKSMLAYQKWGEGDSPEKSDMKPDQFIGRYYVMFNKKLEENPELAKEAQDMLKKWEDSDEETISLWKKMNSWAFEGFKETYKTFNIKFDKQYYESKSYRKGKEIILKGLEEGIFEKNEDGAVIIDLEEEGYDKKILLRSDGTSVYITQDIYLAKQKYNDYNYDRSIYVVGNEQDYHFQVLFEVLNKLELDCAKGCYHFSYGMIDLPSGKMKSREGTVVDADNLYDEVLELSKKEIEKRYDLEEEKILERARKITLSAIIFYILKHDPKKDFTYDPKKSLSFEGETGPYCQYVYARIQSIIRKSDCKAIFNPELMGNEEKKLLKLLSEYPKIVKEISDNYKISLMARYLLELGQKFNNYYSKAKVIQDDKDLESARLYVIESVAQVMKNGLKLLGIEVMDEM